MGVCAAASKKNAGDVITKPAQVRPQRPAGALPWDAAHAAPPGRCAYRCQPPPEPAAQPRTRPRARAPQGSCYGCGAAFQIEVPMAAGYVPPDKYETKRTHRQLNKLLCERCSGLCNGAMIPAVQVRRRGRGWGGGRGFGELQGRAAAAGQGSGLQWQGSGTPARHAPSGPRSGRCLSPARCRHRHLPIPPGPARRAQDFRQRLELAQAPEERAELLGKLLVTPEELRAQLLALRDRKALAVLLVDLLDASGGWAG
jgi:hypothetical protein